LSSFTSICPPPWASRYNDVSVGKRLQVLKRARSDKGLQVYNVGGSLTPNRKIGGQNDRNDRHDCKRTETACPRRHVSIVKWSLRCRRACLSRASRHSRPRRTRAEIG